MSKMREEEVFICSLCTNKFQSKTAIIRHMMSIHNNEPAIKKLQIQSKRLSTAKRRKVLSKDRRTLAKKDNSNTSIGSIKKYRVYAKEFQCEVCQYKTVHMSTFQRHQLKHEGQKMYKCEYCSFATIQPYNLKRHLRDLHPFGKVDPVIIDIRGNALWHR